MKDDDLKMALHISVLLNVYAHGHGKLVLQVRDSVAGCGNIHRCLEKSALIAAMEWLDHSRLRSLPSGRGNLWPAIKGFASLRT